MHVRRTITAAGLAALSLAGAVATPSAAAEQHVHSWHFDDGLAGWQVLDGPGSPDTWVATDDGYGGTAGVALSSYGDDADTTLRSPVLQNGLAGGVLEFRSSHWLRAREDFVTVEVLGPDDTVVRSVVDLSGRGRWPLWDDHRWLVDVPPGGAVQFRFTSDEMCSGTWREREAAGLQLYKTHCGEGFRLDDVRLAPVESARGVAAWGDGPGAVPLDLAASWSKTDDRPREGDGPTPTVAGTVPTSIDGDVRLDQVANPEYLALRDEAGPVRSLDEWFLDPFHRDWARTRGEQLDVWITNRYDTPLGARLFAPREPGPHPLVVFVGGLSAENWSGWWPLLHRLAEDGHVVMTLDPQGGPSSWTPYESASLPSPRFCGTPEKTSNKWWRKPQEGGLVETGFCAGAHGEAGAYSDVEIPYAFGVIDAIDWADSDDNPWRDRIDTSRSAAIGHSIGGHAALLASQLDDRIRATVLLDSAALLRPELAPNTPLFDVPSAWSQATRSTGLLNQTRAHRWRDAGVDAGILSAAGTSHLAGAWLPHDLTGTVDANGPTRSRWAIPVIHHYTSAWLDHHLDGGPAFDRLLATTFDGSADAAAVGQGTWDASHGNVPYLLEGRRVAEHLDPLQPAWFHLGGTTHEIGG